MRKTNVSVRPLCFLSLVLALATLSATLPTKVCGQNQTGDNPVHMYFFTNHGCAPCRQVEPGIQALQNEGYPVTTVFLNQQPQLGQRFSVNRTPTVVLVANNKIVGRHAGLIDGVTLKQWFAAVGVPGGDAFKSRSGGTKVQLSPQVKTVSSAKSTKPAGAFAGTSTLHEGTRRPANQSEERALNATVRLKVEDPEGISYATGTVIHSHQGECLVLTCGHVFRDANGAGEITAEFGFSDGQVQTAPGQLISYDANARDIGLVAIRASSPIVPVPVGEKNSIVERGQKIFSIGCDHGEDPTIRHSEIKNRAAYDGSIKYDIYGRPVDGRSGGGLFNANGELIGVCNAAAVEVDEGIYTALETIHWQIANVNLEHLFDNSTRPAVATGAPVAMPVDGLAVATQSARDAAMTRIQPRQNQTLSNNVDSRLAVPVAPIARAETTPVSWDQQKGLSDSSEMEVIIIVRAKSDPTRTDAITVARPSEQLLDYLANMKASVASSRELDAAQLRRRIAFEDLAPPQKRKPR